jgi:hypothetical protein
MARPYSGQSAGSLRGHALLKLLAGQTARALIARKLEIGRTSVRRLLAKRKLRRPCTPLPKGHVASMVYGVPLGINRANVRSPAITWKIWFRLLVGRAAVMQAASVPVAGSSEKYVVDMPPMG